MEISEIKSIVEALIFAADQPLSIEKIAGVLEGEEKPLIREAVNELVSDYQNEERGIYIEKVAGGFQLRTIPEHAAWIKRLFKSQAQKISKPSMETLSIIAYKQPTTRAELEAIRGVDSGGVLRTLMDRRLIKIVGRKDTPGRPAVYGTTKEFLEAFDLKDLSNLPTLKEALIEKEEEVFGEEDSDEINHNEEADGSRETSEDNSDGGDHIEAQGRVDDSGGESEGGGESSMPPGDEGGPS
jgi:segregation and condensation protein B